MHVRFFLGKIQHEPGQKIPSEWGDLCDLLVQVEGLRLQPNTEKN